MESTGLVTAWQNASIVTRSAGRCWYANARRECERLASLYKARRETVAGIVAALSPRTTWKQNVTEAERCLAGQRVRCLGGNVRKAEAIRSGADPLDVLRGPKVRAFYQALAGDDSACVIDSWMLRAAGHSRDVATPKQYRQFEALIRECAARYQTPVTHFQATVWIHVRGASD